MSLARKLLDLKIPPIVSNILKLQSMGCCEQSCYEGRIWFGTPPLSLSAGTSWLVQHQIKCPYPNQIFKTASVLFIPSCFEDEVFIYLRLGTETCGVGSVPRGNVTRHHCHGHLEVGWSDIVASFLFFLLGTSSLSLWTTAVNWHPGEANRNVCQVDCTTSNHF